MLPSESPNESPSTHQAEDLSVEVLSGFASVDIEAWNRMQPDSPLLDGRFLLALEQSQSACPEEGWFAMPIMIRSGKGDLVAAIPFYQKGHSYGEFVFDHIFADAYHRSGRSYFPKGLVAVPFAPVPGQRFLTPTTPQGGGPKPKSLGASCFVHALLGVADRLELPSVHVNFCSEEESHALSEAGFLIRNDLHYVWKNEGYRDFNDYLDLFRAGKRKNIKRQRRRFQEQGYRVERTLLGAMDSRCLQTFYRLYQATYDRKWGKPYLTLELFRRLAVDEEFAKHFLFTRVLDAEAEDVGAALTIATEQVIYGRNWGADGRLPNIHFEACYYDQIEQAIEQGVLEVQAGIQGTEQKLERGFLPEFTWSAHWFRDDLMESAIAPYLEAERAQIRRVREHLLTQTPFRNSSN